MVRIQLPQNLTLLDLRYLKLTGGTLTGALDIKGSTDVVQLNVAGISGQTANLQAWQEKTFMTYTDVAWITSAGQMYASRFVLTNAGSLSQTAIGFSGDDDTGMYSPAANEWGWVTVGAERIRIDSSGNLSMPGKLSIGAAIGTTAGAQLQINASSLSTIGHIVKGAASQSANLTEYQNSSGNVLSRFTSSGVYQIIDPDRTAGYAEFYHDHAANAAQYPRTFFYGYAHDAITQNYGLYVASGKATGETQHVSFLGVSTNADVKQADSYQIINRVSTSDYSIFTTKAEGAANGGVDGQLPIYIGGSISAQGCLLIPTTNTVLITASSAARVPLSVKAFSGQTADLLQIQNASGTPLSVFDKNGWLGIGDVTPDTPLHVANSAIIVATFETTSGSNHVTALKAGTGKNTNMAFYEDTTVRAYIRYDATNNLFGLMGNGGAAFNLSIADTTGNIGIGLGTTSASAKLHLSAGTATASTGPLKFTSGTLLTAAEAGVVEFLTDALYFTITTSAVRKTIAFLESPSFTTPTLGAAICTTLSVAGNQVVGARVVDARIDDTPNSGDATTDGIIAAIQSILQTHGLAAAA